MSHLGSSQGASPLEIKPPIMPPARVAAPILLKARAASLLSAFSKMSDARSQRLANNNPKIAGMNMNMASNKLVSPATSKGAPAAVLKKQRVPSSLGENERQSRQSKSQSGEQDALSIVAHQ